MADQRLVTDLGRAAAGRVAPGDDQSGAGSGESFGHGQHGRVAGQREARTGVLAAFAGSDEADEQALGGGLLVGGELVVDLVGALLERLLQPTILAKADLCALALGPGLLERVLEQRQLADVLLIVSAAADV